MFLDGNNKTWGIANIKIYSHHLLYTLVELNKSSSTVVSATTKEPVMIWSQRCLFLLMEKSECIYVCTYICILCDYKKLHVRIMTLRRHSQMVFVDAMLILKLWGLCLLEICMCKCEKCQNTRLLDAQKNLYFCMHSC